MHVTAPTGWLNDPNGFIRWNDRYHLFFQHNPKRPLWGPPQWAHVVSDDLVHWHELPPALTPQMPPADPDGCWSGTAVNMDGRLVVHYTGVRDGVQRICRAEPLDDELIRWRKDPANPIRDAPAGEPISHDAYRDPFVWHEGDGYRMIVGSSLDDRGAALLHASDDGRNWRYLHPLVAEPDACELEDGSRTWECPMLLRGDRTNGRPDLLVVGVWDHHHLAHVNVTTGRFENDRFEPDIVHRFDHGHACFYAPQAIARNGRWTLIGWLQEQRPDEHLLEAGWAGVLSLPRDVWIEEGEVRQTFAAETAALRGAETRVDTVTGADRETLYDAVAFEARLGVGRRGSEAYELDVAASPDGEERTRLRVDWNAQQILIDKSATSRRDGPSTEMQTALHPGIGDEVDLHLHVDGSVVEVIVDQRVAISTRIYPSRADATQVVIGGSATGASSRSDVDGPALTGSFWRLG